MNILSTIIMLLCRILFKRYKLPIMYIKGTGKDYPRYLIYTENEAVYRRMEKF